MKMGNKRNGLMTVLLALPLMLVAGCGEYGKVDQGRVIKYDKEKRLVTLIQDSRAEPGNPDYNTLPPHSYALPTDAHETGPEPKAGLRMKLDVDNDDIVIFDPATQNFKTIHFKLVEKKTGVERSDPLVTGKKFPLVDKGKKTITIYSGRQKILETFVVPDEYIDLPEYTWDAGDEVRIYYKEPGKARRFMNISKTDIFKK
jgi:hypothetical protein